LTFGISNGFEKGIFFTNTNVPNKYIEHNPKIINILYHSLNDISKNTFTKIHNMFLEMNDNIILYEPRKYQTKIINRAKDYFLENDKGRLYMPCGTGKTLVCYWISQVLEDHERICIVVPSLYLLSQTYKTWCEMKTGNYLLVGSDAEVKTCIDTGLLLTTSQNEIENYLKEHSEVVIITTYQSSYVLSKVCMKLDFELDMIIYDEAHKTCGESSKLFSYLLNDKNIKTKKRLFTTATERIYKHRNNANSSEEEDEVVSMDNESIYGGVIYNYSFKKAIENGQLCDYKVIAPLINDLGFERVLEKNKLIIDRETEDEFESRYYMTAYLLCQNITERNLTHILTFNNTNANAKKMFDILENMLGQLKMKCNCYYLTGESSMKKRIKVVDSFVNDKCAIISSARIFQEGVDIPIVDCICFCDNKMSTIDIIQSIGRVLRKHESKKFGYIIVPTIVSLDEENLFDMDKSDFGNIRSILKSLGTVDNRIIDEFTGRSENATSSNRKFHAVFKNLVTVGKIEINLSEMFRKVTSIVCDRWGNVCWELKLKQVKEYIVENKRRPSQHNKNKNIKMLGKWIDHQRENYRKKVQIMQNEEIRTIWKEFIEDYSKYFKSNEESWNEILKQVKEYIDENKEKPSQRNKNMNIKMLGMWIQTQRKNYSKNCQIMKNKEIRTLWEEFIRDYSEHFKSNKEIWNDMLKKVKEYIDKNGERPSTTDKNRNIKMLGQWLCDQQNKYSKKIYNMQNDEIRIQWEVFIKDYHKYFKSYEESWNDILKQVKKYINKTEKRPSCHSKNGDIKKLGQWFGQQQKNYPKKTEIMKNKEIRTIWEEFMKEYSHHFKTNEEKWNDTLKRVKDYINENGKRPSSENKNGNIKMLGCWIGTQQKNYPKKVKIMKNKEIRTMWREFIKEYIEYFKTNEEKWKETLKQVKEYIDENGERPTYRDKEVNTKMLGKWIQHQQENYQRKMYIMKNEKFRTIWEDFAKEYL
jgi:superfamily II DNA or RNA helicase/ribosomal protein S20